MSITQEEINKLSKNLNKINPKNEEKLLEGINSLLKYVDLLNEVDTKNVSPTVNVISKNNNKLKDDIIKNQISPSELLKCSNQKIIANQIVINDIMK